MTTIDNFEDKAHLFFSYLKENLSSIGIDLGGNETELDILPEPANDVIDEQPINPVDIEQKIEIPIEPAPNFRIYWKAWKEGNSTSGQTESTLETAQMARAEAMTKLYDLGFTDIEISAIETIKSQENSELDI